MRSDITRVVMDRGSFVTIAARGTALDLLMDTYATGMDLSSVGAHGGAMCVSMFVSASPAGGTASHFDPDM